MATHLSPPSPQLLELRRLAKLIQTSQTPYNHDRWVTYDNHCRTAACLGGYAAQHEPFRQLGLRLYEVGQATEKKYAEPKFQNQVGFGALASFFDLYYDQAVYVFGNDEMKIAQIAAENGVDLKPHKVGFELSDVIERLQQVIDGEVE